MEKYNALDLLEVNDVKSFWADNDNVLYYLLYQTCEEGEEGISVYVKFYDKTLWRINNVRPQSLKYILYEQEEQYYMGDWSVDDNHIDVFKPAVDHGFLSQQAVDNFSIFFENPMDGESVIITPVKTPGPDEIQNLFVNENGFIIMEKVIDSAIIMRNSRMESMYADLKIYYGPDKKKIGERIINYMNCILLPGYTKEDEDYLIRTLEKESENKTAETDHLWELLTKKCRFYYIDSDQGIVYKRDTNEYAKLRCDDREQELDRTGFGYWLAASNVKQLLDKMIVMGWGPKTKKE